MGSHQSLWQSVKGLDRLTRIWNTDFYEAEGTLLNVLRLGKIYNTKYHIDIGTGNRIICVKPYRCNFNINTRAM